MKVSFSDISRLYQAHLDDRRRKDSILCPQLERTVSSVMTDIREEEKAEIVKHVANCATCARALKDLLNISGEIDNLAGQINILSRVKATQHSPDTKSRWLWIIEKPLVASLIGLVAVAIVTFSVIQLVDHSGKRGRRTDEIQAIFPMKASVSKDGIQFKWKPLDNVSYYAVELFDKSLAMVWRSGPIHYENILISATDTKGIIPGETYYWIVTAVLNDHSEKKSKLVEFSVSR